MILFHIFIDIFAEIIQNNWFQVIFNIFLYFPTCLQSLFEAYELQFLRGKHFLELAIHLRAVSCLFIAFLYIIAKLFIELCLSV